MNNTESKQKKYYNSIGEDYEKHYADSYALMYRFKLYEKLLNGIDIQDKVVLDAMCGGGQSGLFFDKYNCKITGVDISEKQCEFFRQKMPHQLVLCSSILDYVPNKKFDIIITDSLHHLHPNVDQVLKKFDSFLKEGGYLICWEPNRESFFDLLRRLIYKLDSKFFLENEKSISLNQILKQLPNYKSKKVIYGGNVGYLFLNLSMVLRLKISYKKYFYNILMNLDSLIEKLQFKFNSLWLLVVLKK